jgi:tetratricopeptide (TPR) repeat protein
VHRHIEAYGLKGVEPINRAFGPRHTACAAGRVDEALIADHALDCASHVGGKIRGQVMGIVQVAAPHGLDQCQVDRSHQIRQQTVARGGTLLNGDIGRQVQVSLDQSVSGGLENVRGTRVPHLVGQSQRGQQVVVVSFLIRETRNLLELGVVVIKIMGGPKRLDEALIAFDQAIRLDPKEAMYHINKENVLQQQGKLVEAQQAYENFQQLRQGFN